MDGIGTHSLEDMVKLFGVTPLLRNIAGIIEDFATPGTYSEIHYPLVAEKIRDLIVELEELDRIESKKYLKATLNKRR